MRKSKRRPLAPNYFENASKSLLKMRDIVPLDIIENGLMKQGIIVRHLVLPKCFEDSKKILHFINDELGNNTIISVMSQYTPCYKALSNEKLKNRLNKIEYKIVLNEIKKLNFKNCYIQDFCSASLDYTPNFDKESEIDF